MKNLHSFNHIPDIIHKIALCWFYAYPFPLKYCVSHNILMYYHLSRWVRFPERNWDYWSTRPQVVRNPDLIKIELVCDHEEPA